MPQYKKIQTGPLPCTACNNRQDSFQLKKLPTGFTGTGPNELSQHFCVSTYDSNNTGSYRNLYKNNTGFIHQCNHIKTKTDRLNLKKNENVVIVDVEIDSEIGSCNEGSREKLKKKKTSKLKNNYDNDNSDTATNECHIECGEKHTESFSVDKTEELVEKPLCESNFERISVSDDAEKDLEMTIVQRRKKKSKFLNDSSLLQNGREVNQYKAVNGYSKFKNTGFEKKVCNNANSNSKKQTKSPSFDIDQDFPPLSTEKTSSRVVLKTPFNHHILKNDDKNHEISNKKSEIIRNNSNDSTITKRHHETKGDDFNHAPRSSLREADVDIERLSDIEKKINCSEESKKTANPSVSPKTQAYYNLQNQDNIHQKTYDSRNLYNNQRLSAEQTQTYPPIYPMAYQPLPHPRNLHHAYFRFPNVLPHQSSGFMPRQSYFPVQFPINNTLPDQFINPQTASKDQHFPNSNRPYSNDMSNSFIYNSNNIPANIQTNFQASQLKSPNSIKIDGVDGNNVAGTSVNSYAGVPQNENVEQHNNFGNVFPEVENIRNHIPSVPPSTVDTLGFSPDLQKIIQEAFGLQPGEGVFYVYVIDSHANHRRQFRCFMHSTTPVKFDKVPYPVLLEPNCGPVGQVSPGGYYYVSRENMANTDGENPKTITQCRPIYNYSATIPEEYRMANSPYYYPNLFKVPTSDERYQNVQLQNNSNINQPEYLNKSNDNNSV